MVGLSDKLTSLVEASENPNVFLSVLLTLNPGSPQSTGSDGGFPKRVFELRKSLMKIPAKWCQKMQRQQELLARLKMLPLLLDQKERQLTGLLFQQASLEVFIRHLPLERPEELRKLVKQGPPLIRLLALGVVGRRHLHLETELIECLNDPELIIRTTARAALVHIARGTDFGPFPGSSRRGMERSIDKWRNWLTLQEAGSPTPLDKSTAVAKREKTDSLQPVQLLLDPGNRELQTVRPEVSRLRGELVNARGDEQRSILARMRDASGDEPTDALSLAIAGLPEALRPEAEDALTQRLTRLTPTSLRDKLQDDQVEIRRAAAFACGRKLAKELLPDLVQLLDDPEKDVIQAARAALIELTGEDFGPTKDADRRGREDAMAAWRKWCKERFGTKK
jgi:hypothetical protein